MKIIRGGQSIKILSNDIERCINGSMDGAKARIILNRIDQLITTLESVIFSASALIYREEKSLIKFSKRVEDAIEKLLKKSEHDKRRYAKDVSILRKKQMDLKKNKKHLPRKLKWQVEEEKREVDKDEELKRKAVSVLEQLTGVVKNMESRIYTSRLEAKAQKRETFNIYKVQETVIIRSNFRLGELIGRRGGIEAGALEKKINELIEVAEEKLKKLNKGEYDESEIQNLVKCSTLESKDLNDVIHLVILASQRVRGWLGIMRRKISEDTQLRKFGGEWRKAAKRFEDLKEDIFTQVKRLDNELSIRDIPTHLLKDLKKSY